jgi:arsenate reductase (glutaredoxin)
MATAEFLTLCFLDANDLQERLFCESFAIARRKLRCCGETADLTIKGQGHSHPQRTEQKRMKATIWHNPNCGTSRKTLAILQETPGVDLTIVEYLKNPPTRDRLAALYAKAGITAQQGLRTRGAPAEELGLTQPGTRESTILEAMEKEPILIERPLVETEKGVRLCRPQELVHEIL